MNKSDLLATALLGGLAGLALYEGFSIKAPALTDLFEQHVVSHTRQQQASWVNIHAPVPAPARMVPVQKGWGMARGRPFRYRERATVLPIPGR
jgi:hypothetical protein